MELLTLCPVQTRFPSSPQRGQAELQALVFGTLLVLNGRDVKIRIDTNTCTSLWWTIWNDIAVWNQRACVFCLFCGRNFFVLHKWKHVVFPQSRPLPQCVMWPPTDITIFSSSTCCNGVAVLLSEFWSESDFYPSYHTNKKNSYINHFLLTCMINKKSKKDCFQHKS